MATYWAETAEQKAAWDAFLCSHAHATPYLLSWYLDQQRLPRCDPHIVCCEQNQQIVAGAAVFIFRMPAAPVFLVPSGPFVRPDYEKFAPELLEAIAEKARSVGAALLQFEAFEADRRDDIRDHFKQHRTHDVALWKLYHPTLWRDYRVDLRGKTHETLLASYSKTTRQRVREAAKKNVEIIEVRDDAGIDMAHELWTIGGERREYTIRPRESFRALVQAGWKRESAALLVSRLDGRPAAMVYSIFYGAGAMYLYGAHVAEISGGVANRVLQHRVMCMAIDRGIPYYSLGGPAEGGIREYKEGFRPYLADQWRFVAVELRPALLKLLKPVISRAGLMGRAKRWMARGME